MPTKDQHYEKVVLLLHGDGANTGTVFTDNSQYQQVATATGNAQTSNDITLINGSTIKLNVASNTHDSVRFSGSPYFDIGGDDFTIEMQFYSAVSHYGKLLTIGNNYDINTIDLYVYTNQSLSLVATDTNGTGQYMGTGVDTIPINTKISVGITYQASSKTLSLYVNNTLMATQVLTAGMKRLTNPILTIGAFTSSNTTYYEFRGYIEEFRLTTGVIRDVTVAQTAAFPDEGYSFQYTIAESLVANNFKIYVNLLSNGSLWRSQVAQAGTVKVPAPFGVPVMVTVVPIVGDVWKPATAYSVNDLVFPIDTIGTPYYYKRISAGTSGSTEPVWGTTPASQCDDGAITNAWELVEQFAAPVTNAPLIAM